MKTGLAGCSISREEVGAAVAVDGLNRYTIDSGVVHVDLACTEGSQGGSNGQAVQRCGGRGGALRLAVGHGTRKCARAIRISLGLTGRTCSKKVT